jgi:manganese/zinc/iron transport system permease protein
MILWLLVTSIFTTVACAIPGSFLVLKRMSLTGDAISHSVLPGIILGFIVSGSLTSPWLVFGAAACGWFTVILIQTIHRHFKIREDAATGIVFTTMFAIGVIMLRSFASKIDLDPDCILFGNLETVIHGQQITLANWQIPVITVQAFAACLLAIIVTALLFHRFVSSSFDLKLSSILGLSPERASTILLALTATVVVIAFQAVGALMTVALLVLPATTALLLKTNIRFMLPTVTVIAILSSVTGLQLALTLNLNLGASIVLAGAGLFILVLLSTKLRSLPRSGNKCPDGFDRDP